MEYCRRRYLRLAAKDIGLVRQIKQWQFHIQSHCQLITIASVTMSTQSELQIVGRE